MKVEADKLYPTAADSYQKQRKNDESQIKDAICKAMTSEVRTPKV